MNDHLPPPRRSIPAHEHAAMRERLRHEMGGRTSHSPKARFWLFAPALAAAATMAVVAVGGYVSLGGGGESPGTGDESPTAGFASAGTTIAPPPDEGACADIGAPFDELSPVQSGPGPGGGTVGLETEAVPPSGDGPGTPGDMDGFLEPDDSIVEPDQAVAPGRGVDDEGAPPAAEPAQCEAMVPVDTGPPTSTEVANPGPVFERCDQLVRERFPAAGATTRRLAIENGAVRTAVLSDGPTTYLCHLGPDIEEVSTDGTHTSGRHLWAGGQLPPDATGMGVTTMDGDRTYRAVIRDGWWALQGLEDEPIGDDAILWTEKLGAGGGVVSGSSSGELCSEDDVDC
jgi:hypothetical protein